MSELVPRSGNYKKLISYQKTDAIFQITYFSVTISYPKATVPSTK